MIAPGHYAWLAHEEGEPVAQGRPWCHIPQRRRGHQHASTECRLITASLKFQHSSLIEAHPNPAHEALARLEAALPGRGGKLTLVTQNIDDLHERAGTQGVFHMHGELLRARCVACQAENSWRDNLGIEDSCPSCHRTGTLRPHVVWFGETPLHMELIEDALDRADLFVAIGTSGSVYPAAGFVAKARAQSVLTCELNLEPSDNAYLFDVRRYGPASMNVTAWVDELLQG